MTLWDLPPKHNAEIDSLCQTLVPNVASRLHEMGFAQGQTVHCVRRIVLKGPVVVQLGDCVFSLEQDVASKISLR